VAPSVPTSIEEVLAGVEPSVPTSIEEVLEELKKLGHSIKPGNLKNFCRYCGACASSGWGDGPQGPRTLCRVHAHQFKTNALVLNFLVESPQSPQEALRPDLNTEMHYLLRVLESTYIKSGRPYPYKRQTRKQEKQDDTEEYNVEAIVTSKMDHGKEFFLIKWEGYGDSGKVFDCFTCFECVSYQNYCKSVMFRKESMRASIKSAEMLTSKR
jgi:hypothetical protein